jgi:hypothetical protein
MAYFERMKKVANMGHVDGDWDAAVVKGGRPVLPKHLQDKNQGHTDQGADGSVPTQEGALAEQQANGDESNFQPYDDLDTTNQ